MRVLIQWATATVNDWVEYNITNLSQVRALPKKPVPSDSPVIDDQPGWIAAVNIQGITFTGFDHIGFGMSTAGLVVTCWNDDPVDFPAGTRWGQVWTLADPAPDPALPVPSPDPNPSWARGLVNGVSCYVNTRQTVVWYGEAQSAPVLAGVPDVLPWSQLSTPNQNNTIHGTWTPDGHWAALEGARSPHDWREWVA